MTTQPQALFIMGPTASGKTDLAIAVYQYLAQKARIISVDSALVYRELDIGTAKPTAEVLAQAPHQLINLINPDEVYSVAQFRQAALAELDFCQTHDLLPIFVGGTSLYFRALEYGLSTLPPSSPEIRQKLNNEREETSLKAMHQRLQQIDPVAAKRIHPNDPQRLMRALEVYEITKKSLTELQQANQKTALPFNITKVVVAPKDRAVLHQRIATRFQQMLALGFEQEVKNLLQHWDLDAQSPAMRAVGYRQMFSYLQGDMDYKTMTEKGVIATRQLAKRQFTWLRAEKKALWLDEKQDLLKQVIRQLS